MNVIYINRTDLDHFLIIIMLIFYLLCYAEMLKTLTYCARYYAHLFQCVDLLCIIISFYYS